MKFFLDTANLAQIREANALGVLDGVTTNPSLMAKEGIKGAEGCKQHYLDICDIVNGDVSAEVLATDFEGMVREGKELASLHPNIVVKIPCIAEGIKAIRYLYGKGIRTNCTLVFSPGQALLAAKAGALMFLLLWEDWMIFRAMASIWYVKLLRCILFMALKPRCWLRPFDIHSTSFSALKWERTWLHVL